MLERRPGKSSHKPLNSPDIMPNLLLNGDFQVAQRGPGPFTSATDIVNNDDSYLLDQWIFLADGADTCDVSQTSSVVPAGAKYAIALDVEQANRKFGILNIVENQMALSAIGSTVSLSFKARTSGSTLGTIRAAVLAWSGTADTVTSDVVSSWGAAGSDPTLVVNWTYENVPIPLSVSNTYQTFSIPGVSIDTANTTNIAVFIWLDDTVTTIGDFLYIADVKLEKNARPSNFVHRSNQSELSDCQRFYYGMSGFAAGGVIAPGFNTSTTGATFCVPFPVPLRVDPSNAISPILSAVSNFQIDHAGGSITCTGKVTVNISHSKFAGDVQMTTSGLTSGDSSRLAAATTTALVGFSAEL